MEFMKKNLALIVGIGLPALMIVLVAASIYLPRFVTTPAHNFLYTTEDYRYRNMYMYEINDDKVVKNEFDNVKPTTSYNRTSKPKLFLYDVEADESREVTLAEVAAHVIDDDRESPDGFSVVHGSRSDSFFPLFLGSDTDYSTRYLKKGAASKKINVEGDSYYGRNNFRFLGWIVE